MISLCVQRVFHLLFPSSLWGGEMKDPGKEVDDEADYYPHESKNPTSLFEVVTRQDQLAKVNP